MPRASEAETGLLTLPQSLWPFVRAVLADSGAMARLGAIYDPERFAAEAQALAAEFGVPLDAVDLQAAIRPDPAGIGRWEPAPRTTTTWPEGAWLPTRSVPASDGPAFDWAWFGEAPLSHPFYEDSVRRQAGRPLNLLLHTRTRHAALIAGAEGADSLPIAGLILHMSRCGSTLLAQMLAAAPGTVVVSEPEPFDAVLQWARQPGVERGEAIATLRAIAAALGRRRAPDARRVVFKLDAWHTLSLPLLREAFPGVPWLYLYRNPTEVLASQLREPGIHVVPGRLAPPVLALPDGDRFEREEFCARVLAAVGEAILTHWRVGGGLLVNYEQLPDAGWSQVAAHFGLAGEPHLRAAMSRATKRDSKRPGAVFAPDSAAKLEAASAAVRRAVERYLAPIHCRLDALRLGEIDQQPDFTA